MSLAARRVRVSVPATSANLGSGYDTLGLALDIHDTIEVAVVDEPTHVEVVGEGAGEVPTGEDHLVVRSIRFALAKLGVDVPGLSLTCRNVVPHARGLGSSAAAIVGGLAAGYALARGGDALDERELVAWASELEGHPDNVAPAVYGGMCVSWMSDGRGHAQRVPSGGVVALTLAVPATRLATATARGVLPSRIPHDTAAHAASRCALFVACVAAGGGDWMAATSDRLHQPYRRDVMPESFGLIDAWRREEIPAVLSGAGPSVLAVVEVSERARADAERRGFRVWTTSLAETGVEATCLE